MLPLVIVNPSSAGGSTGKAWPNIASELATHFGPYSCAFTSKRGDAVKLAKQGALERRRFVIACGGDGTISEVVNGILESGVDVELGILPSGTGGDFQRTLRIPTRRADAVRELRIGTTTSIDVGHVTYLNNEENEESRFFIGVASFGMSGDVIRRVKQTDSRWLSGRAAFALAMLKTTIGNQNTVAHVQIEDEKERMLTVANLCVANGRYFGGGMKIAPNAKLNDGKFDVVTIGDLGPAKILSNAHQLYLGTHLGMKQVHHALAARVSIRSVDRIHKIALEVDGELPGHLPASFKNLPGALRVRMPNSHVLG